MHIYMFLYIYFNIKYQRECKFISTIGMQVKFMLKCYMHIKVILLDYMQVQVVIYIYCIIIDSQAENGFSIYPLKMDIAMWNVWELISKILPQFLFFFFCLLLSIKRTATRILPTNFCLHMLNRFDSFLLTWQAWGRRERADEILRRTPSLGWKQAIWSGESAAPFSLFSCPPFNWIVEFKVTSALLLQGWVEQTISKQ